MAHPFDKVAPLVESVESIVRTGATVPSLDQEGAVILREPDSMLRFETKNILFAQGRLKAEAVFFRAKTRQAHSFDLIQLSQDKLDALLRRCRKFVHFLISPRYYFRYHLSAPDLLAAFAAAGWSSSSRHR